MYAESEEAKMKKITACLCIMAVTMFFAFFLFYPWSKKVYEDTYELIIWRTIGGKDNIEFYLFPENLKNHVV